MKRAFSVRPENLSYYLRIANLEDDAGHKALTPAHLRIVEYVGSFQRRYGCFASERLINSETINAKSPKTIRRHLQYLVAIRVLSVSKEKVEGEDRRIFRLEMPPGNSVVTQKDFRVKKGMSEYAYVMRHAVVKKVVEIVDEYDDLDEVLIPEMKAMSKQDAKNEGWEDFFTDEPKKKEPVAPQEPSLFSDPEVEKLAAMQDFFAADEAKFAPILKNKTNQNTNQTKDNPPKVPPSNDFESRPGAALGAEGSLGSLRDPNRSPNDRRPVQESSRFPDRSLLSSTSSNNSNENSEAEGWDEPLVEKKRVKKPKNQQERRAEAAREASKGHIVNPLGRTDNRKRSHDWRKACDIGPTGKVTQAQLWKHLNLLWLKAFSNDDADERTKNAPLAMQISDDRVSVRTFFDDIEGKLKKVYATADYRTVSEYFSWFLSPERLAGKFLNESNRFANPTNAGLPFINVRQLAGETSIRIFYDKILKIRELQNRGVEAPQMTESEEKVVRINRIWKEFEHAVQDDTEFCFKIVENGFALAAQYLHDEHRANESECRQRIIKVMASFIKSGNEDGPEGLKATLAFLRQANATTKSFAAMLTPTCIWYNWQEKTSDLIDVAIEQAGVKYVNEDNRGPKQE